MFFLTLIFAFITAAFGQHFTGDGHNHGGGQQMMMQQMGGAWGQQAWGNPMMQQPVTVAGPIIPLRRGLRNLQRFNDRSVVMPNPMMAGGLMNPALWGPTAFMQWDQTRYAYALADAQMGRSEYWRGRAHAAEEQLRWQPPPVQVTAPQVRSPAPAAPKPSTELEELRAELEQLKRDWATEADDGMRFCLPEKWIRVTKRRADGTTYTAYAARPRCITWD